MLRWETGKDFVLIVGVTLLLAIFIFAGLSNIMRTVLGIIFIAIIPGYALQAALFPGRRDLKDVERIALGFALSVAAVPLLILILNYTPWGISEKSVFVIVAAFIFSAALVAIYRRTLLPEGEYFKFATPRFSSLGSLLKADKIFSIALIGTTIFSIVCFYFFAAKPKNNGFSEFYLTTPDYKIENFSQGLIRGSDIVFVVGLRNFELEDCDYTIKIYVGGSAYATIGPFNLKIGEKREETIRLSPGIDFTGNAKVECMLFKNSDTEPYRTVQLWID